MMRQDSGSRALRWVLAAWIVMAPLSAAAQQGTPPPAPAPAAVVTADPSLDQAKELIKNGDYDRAIDLLKSAIERGKHDEATLREAYLLLIKTYVFLGNDYKFKPQGREMSNLNYRAARDLIVEALGRKELRHLKPEPASEFPPEMIASFAEVRNEIFGSFRVARLAPPTAMVILDGDTLGLYPGDSMPGDVDLPVGKHLVVVRAPGYKDATDEVTIAPGANLERAYALQKGRSPAWYATWGAAAVGVVVGGIALASGGGGSGTTEPTALPGAPPPPNR
jgi:hypothetical protein